jgi:hypothetical protein
MEDWVGYRYNYLILINFINRNKKIMDMMQKINNC